MEILTWIIIALVVILAVLCAYMWHRKTVKHSKSKQYDCNVKKTRKWFQYFGMAVLFVAVICTAFFGFLYFNNDIGVREAGLEADIRSSQKIHDDWLISGEVSNTMAAFISYSQDKSDHAYSVYVNRPGLSFGYFFREGGNIAAVEESIYEYTVDGYNERAFISMNTQKVERLEIDDGNKGQSITIDSEKPFVIVLPLNAGNICFYDIQGNIVEFEKELFIS